MNTFLKGRVKIFFSGSGESELLQHHHVPERFGMFPVRWSSRWSWSLHLFLGRPFGLYCSACFGSLFVSILCTSFTMELRAYEIWRMTATSQFQISCIPLRKEEHLFKDYSSIAAPDYNFIWFLW